MERNQLILLL